MMYGLRATPFHLTLPTFVSFIFQTHRISSFGIHPLQNARKDFGGSKICLMASKNAAQVATANHHQPTKDGDEDSFLFQSSVEILSRGAQHIVVNKPPSVVCHRSTYTGTKSRKTPEVPMLQRVRTAVGRRINMVHRLDRGASGCLLCAFAEESDQDSVDSNGESEEQTSHSDDVSIEAPICSNATSLLHAEISESKNKTYVALVRGEGVLHGRDFKDEGWFLVDRPIKDDGGKIRNATTWFRFVAGQDNQMGTIDRPRASLVLARPQTGRWHQIRRHLNGLSHPILGDTSHGNSKTNMEWRERGMPGERLCLHLSKLELGPVAGVLPDGLSVTSPLPDDMMDILRQHLPNVLADAEPILKEEGIDLEPENDQREIVPIELRIAL